MADHIRQQIIDAAFTAVTGLATTGSNVYEDEDKRRFEEGNLPALLIYDQDEESEPDNMNRPRGLDRQMDLNIEAVAMGTSGVGRQLNLICKEVEVALGNSTLGGLAKDIWLASTKKQIDLEGKKIYGTRLLTFTVEYRTPENDPTTTV